MRIFDQLLTDGGCPFFHGKTLDIVPQRALQPSVVDSVVTVKTLIFYRDKGVFGIFLDFRQRNYIFPPGYVRHLVSVDVIEAISVFDMFQFRFIQTVRMRESDVIQKKREQRDPCRQNDDSRNFQKFFHTF